MFTGRVPMRRRIVGGTAKVIDSKPLEQGLGRQVQAAEIRPKRIREERLPRRRQLRRSSRLSAIATPEFAMPIGRATKSRNFVISTEGWREA